MLIDRKHNPWIIITTLSVLVTAILYIGDVTGRIDSPGGSTPLGLTFGIAAYALMLFCAMLGLKRRVPSWRFGRAQTWLRGHIWLGLLSVWLVALHAAFSAGGPLTTWLWIVLGIVTASGVVGVILQQSIPSALLHGIPNETVAQQAQRRIDDLPHVADALVIEYAGSLDKPAPPWREGDVEKPPADGEPLRLFHERKARPYLQGENIPDLEDPPQAERAFDDLRIRTRPHVHPGIDALEQLCLQRHHWRKQQFLMKLLLAWLIVHVPLSWALIAMTAIHAIIALRYG
jgi:hypothetical protein